jgi:hypothetical protein
MPLASPGPHPVGPAKSQQERRGPSPWSGVLREVLPSHARCGRQQVLLRVQGARS